MNESGETGEHLHTKQAFGSLLPTRQPPLDDSERSGKYLCLRCCWRWSARPGFPDPPTACSHCRSAYWNAPPATVRANRPDNPKWKAERDAKADRRRARHLARLKELAQELDADARKTLESMPRIFQCGHCGFCSTDRPQVERHLMTHPVPPPHPQPVTHP